MSPHSANAIAVAAGRRRAPRLLGAAAVAVAALQSCVFSISFVSGSSPSRAAGPQVARYAREPGSAPGSGSSRDQNEYLSKKAATATVDDGDFSGELVKKSGAKASGFNSLLAEADKFASKSDRTSRKSKSLSLEDELSGLSLEDDTDLDAIMMRRARGGKASDVSLSVRLSKWVEETKEIIANPTKQQVTYGIIFGASVAILLLTGAITFALGGVRLQGDGVETARRRLVKQGDAYVQRMNMMRDNRRKFAEMDDVRKYNSDMFTMNPDSKINFSPKKLEDTSVGDVLDAMGNVRN